MYVYSVIFLSNKVSHNPEDCLWSNGSKTARGGVDRRIGVRIEARMGRRSLGRDRPGSHCGTSGRNSACPQSFRFFYLEIENMYFCRLLSVKLKMFLYNRKLQKHKKLRMYHAWWLTLDL